MEQLGEVSQNREQFGIAFKGLTITTGKKVSPLKGIVYGDNGVGKTTLLAQSRSPVIADMEGNCGHIDAPKCRIKNLKEFEDLLQFLLHEEHEFKSLVIDSLDSLEGFLSEHINQAHTTQELSYGKSKEVWTKYIATIVNKLEKLSAQKGINILFTAHWKRSTANNPMTEQYDRYDLRINEVMRTGFCNWVQFIILALKEAILDSKESAFGKKRAKSLERRVLFTRGDPTYYGKNVFNMPEKIKMDWDELTNNVKNFYAN